MAAGHEKRSGAPSHLRCVGGQKGRRGVPRGPQQIKVKEQVEMPALKSHEPQDPFKLGVSE